MSNAAQRWLGDTYMEATVKTATLFGKFNGNLSRLQTEAFGDMRRFGLSEGAAHKVAMDFASDYGRLMATEPDFAAKVGKANKDGNATLKVVVSGKIAVTRSMSSIRTYEQLHALKKEGLITETPKHDELSLNENVENYIRDCESWAAHVNE
jgi:hypothetical protein